MTEPTKTIATTKTTPSAIDSNTDPSASLQAAPIDTPPAMSTSEPIAGTPPNIATAPKITSSAYDEVGIWAKTVDDLETLRIAEANRVYALTETLGLDPKGPGVRRLISLANATDELEKQAIKGLQAAVKACPVGDFVESVSGAGYKQVGRLLGEIGDPATRDMPSQLWAYCGLHVVPADHYKRDPHNHTVGQNATGTQTSSADQQHAATQTRYVGQEQLGTQTSLADQNPNGTQLPIVGVAPRRKRGERANWSTEARKRSWLIANSLIKQRGTTYRAVYDAGRVKYADAVHNVPCVRCGTDAAQTPNDPQSGPGGHQSSDLQNLTAADQTSLDPQQQNVGQKSRDTQSVSADQDTPGTHNSRVGRAAPVGSPLRLGHQHARALRLVQKAFILDLWIAARQAAGLPTSTSR